MDNRNRKRSANANANANNPRAKRQRTDQTRSNMLLSRFKQGTVRTPPNSLIRPRTCVLFTDDTLTQAKGYGEFLDDADLFSRVPDIILDSSSPTSIMEQIVDGGVYNYILFADPQSGEYFITATYTLPLEFGTKHADIYGRLTPEQRMNFVCSGEFSFNRQTNSLLINEMSSLFFFSENIKYLEAAAVLAVAPDILQHIQYLVDGNIAYKKIPISSQVFKAGQGQEADVLKYVATANGDDVKLLATIYEEKGEQGQKITLCKITKINAMIAAYNRMFLEVVEKPFKSIFGVDIILSFKEVIMLEPPQLQLRFTNSTKDLFCRLKTPLKNKMYATQENCAANRNPTSEWCNNQEQEARFNYY